MSHAPKHHTTVMLSCAEIGINFLSPGMSEPGCVQLEREAQGSEKTAWVQRKVVMGG